MDKKFLLFLALIAAIASATTSRAEIIFAPPETMADDLDVSRNGELIYAYCGALEDQVSNGVIFLSTVDPVDFQGEGNVTTNTFDQILNSTFDGNGMPPAGSANAALSLDYRTLLEGAVVAPSTATTAEVTLGNLVSERDYEVQLWIHDARNIGSGRVSTVTSGSHSVTLAHNSSAVDPAGTDQSNNGGVGQYTIGMFTASAPTETFTISVPAGQGGLQLNAIQVRERLGPLILGDINRDGVANFQDIAPFIQLLRDGRYQREADINGCGQVNFLQIIPFIRVLSGEAF